MANKIISNLTPKTSPAAADLLAIEDTEATKKIDYNALADAILNKITSKTYSVAGSTQTLISAIDALNSNLYNANLGTVINNNNDLDTYTEPGTYYCDSASKAATLAHCPVNTSGFKLLVIRTGYENANLIQIIEVPIGLNDGGSTYRRMGNPSAWGNWVKSPTRYDIDTLNNSKAFVSWGTSLACTGPFGLLLINQNYNVVVRLASTSEIDVKVEYTNGTTHNAYTKHGTDNTVSFGATSSDSTCTITRSGTNFTVSVTGNSTIGWVAYSK